MFLSRFPSASFVSIHAPRAGCDLAATSVRTCPATFQSTHPVRGATLSMTDAAPPRTFQSTHPVRGATCPTKATSGLTVSFNPRTPCGVRHASGARSRCGTLCFNPRTPCGVRRLGSRCRSGTTCFNPRTPCGVRLSTAEMLLRSLSFQSTHPVRGATAGVSAD